MEKTIYWVFVFMVLAFVISSATTLLVYRQKMVLLEEGQVHDADSASTSLGGSSSEGYVSIVFPLPDREVSTGGTVSVTIV